MSNKPRVAFFDFASCEGCQLQVANLEEEVLDLIDLVDVVSFREVMKEHSDDYDIAIIEGSIMRPIDETRLRKIRSHAKILVAFGACACIGGVNKIRNQWDVDNVKKEVYGNGVITYYEYSTDDFRMNNLVTPGFQDYHYLYDKVGNITSILDTIASETATYAYDDLNRLESAYVDSSEYNFNYFYNSIGNMMYVMSLTDTVRYIYGESSAGPHAVTSIKTNSS